jgi:addiction module RelE/StbE family toxin
MVKIIWTELALEDLKNIYDFIAKDSKVYANRIIEKIISRVDQLEQFPKSGRIVPEIDKKNIRELIEGSYRIIYKTTVQNVFVVRIHHAARAMK